MSDEKQKRKSRRLSKSEEEKRTHILERELLDKWVCVKNTYDDEQPYFYIKHVLGTRGKTTRIKQIIISSYEEQDGIYEISDYELGFVFDAKTKKRRIEIKLKKYDMKYGLYSEQDESADYEELLNTLIKEGYLTKSELYAMLHGNFYLTCEEVELSYVRNNRNFI